MEEPEGIIVEGSPPPGRRLTSYLSLIVRMDGDGLSDGGFALRQPDAECAQATSVNMVTLPTP